MTKLNQLVENYKQTKQTQKELQRDTYKLTTDVVQQITNSLRQHLSDCEVKNFEDYIRISSVIDWATQPKEIITINLRGGRINLSENFVRKNISSDVMRVILVVLTNFTEELTNIQLDTQKCNEFDKWEIENEIINEASEVAFNQLLSGEKVKFGYKTFSMTQKSEKLFYFTTESHMGNETKTYNKESVISKLYPYVSNQTLRLMNS